MKRILNLGLMSLVLTIWSSSSSAYEDGNTLLKDCEAAIRFSDTSVKASAEDAFPAGMCFGKITGLRDMSSFQGLIYPETKSLFCVPEKVINNQLAMIGIKYMKDNPAMLHKRGTSILILAFRDAFPCKSETN